MKKRTLLPALLLALSATGCSLLETDYPAGDPDQLRGRLTHRAQWAWDAMDLPPGTTVTGGAVDTRHTCLTGGLTIDETRADTVVFGLDWTVEEIPLDRARPVEARLRRQFAAQGWTLVHDGNRRGKGFVHLGFRFEDPATGDLFDLSWNDSTTSLFLTGYTPCATVPEPAADAAAEAVWAPRRA